MFRTTVALVVVLATLAASTSVAAPPDGTPVAAPPDGTPGGRPAAAGSPPGDASAQPRPTATPGPGAVLPGAGTAASRNDAAILAVYANPAREGDRGEFVVVRLPDGGDWSLADDEATVAVPDEAAGVVALTPAPGAVGPLVEYPVVRVDGALRLANGGETLRLLRGSRPVDAVSYERAPEGEVLHVEAGEWRPLGATDFAPARAGPATVEAFVLPDAPGVPTRVLGDADERILLAGYTFTSWRVARALAAANERRVTVRVLVEGGPVGGVSRRGAAVLDWLVARGVPVAVVAGERARYRFQHAKYAVVDDRAVVLTENWKPSGTGGRASRGWGAVVDSGEVADHLAAVFRADAGWRDTVPWREFRQGRSFSAADPANGSYPARFEPRTVRAESVGVLVAPDNAERGIVGLVRSAREEVLVQQVSVGGRDQPFLRATLAAARRGVRVRVLLSSAWYVRDENRGLVRWLNDLADREGLPLEARLAEPRSRYEKIHAKGVVVDRERVLVGSVNWNNHSARQNREVALVLEGEAVGAYYARAFRADWRGGSWRIPVGFAVGTLVVGLGVGWVLFRRMTWVPVDRPDS